MRESAAVAEVAHAAAHPMRARLRRRRRASGMDPSDAPVLAKERRDRRVDHDRRAAGDAGTRAPGELHLLAAAAITERRIDRSMRAAETRCSAAAARQRPLACSWRTTRQAEDDSDASAHLRLMGDRAGCESPRVQALALSVYPFLLALHASVLVRWHAASSKAAEPGTLEPAGPGSRVITCVAVGQITPWSRYVWQR